MGIKYPSEVTMKYFCPDLAALPPKILISICLRVQGLSACNRHGKSTDEHPTAYIASLLWCFRVHRLPLVWYKVHSKEKLKELKYHNINIFCPMIPVVMDGAVAIQDFNSVVSWRYYYKRPMRLNIHGHEKVLK